MGRPPFERSPLVLYITNKTQQGPLGVLINMPLTNTGINRLLSDGYGRIRQLPCSARAPMVLLSRGGGPFTLGE